VDSWADIVLAGGLSGDRAREAHAGTQPLLTRWCWSPSGTIAIALLLALVVPKFTGMFEEFGRRSHCLLLFYSLSHIPSQVGIVCYWAV